LEGESRKGRQCREWLEDVKEWGGEEIHILNRKAQDHVKIIKSIPSILTIITKSQDEIKEPVPVTDQARFYK